MLPEPEPRLLPLRPDPERRLPLDRLLADRTFKETFDRSDKTSALDLVLSDGTTLRSLIEGEEQHVIAA